VSETGDTDFALALAPSASQVARRLLIVTQVIFFGALFWCVLLVHDHAVENAGISYYGVHARTIPLAIIGYVTAAIGVWRASTILRDAGVEAIGWVGLRCVAVMLILLLLTPYNGGTILNWAHMTIGVAGALVQLTMTAALWRRTRSSSVGLAGAVQLLGGIVAALSLPDWSFEYLLVGEIVFQAGFAWCLLEWTGSLQVARFAGGVRAAR
jgi:hypothetical protein